MVLEGLDGKIKDAILDYDLSKADPERFKESFPITQPSVIEGITRCVESKKIGKIDTRHRPEDLVAECLFMPGSIVGVVLKDVAIEARNVGGGILNMALNDLGAQSNKLADKILKDEMSISEAQFTELHTSLKELQAGLKANQKGQNVDLSASVERFNNARDTVLEEAIDKDGTKEIMDKVKGGVQKARGILEKFRKQESDSTSAISTSALEIATAQSSQGSHEGRC